MHRLSNLQSAETLVGNLLLLERSGDHSVDFATRSQCGVRHQTHQSNVAPAIDQGDLALGKQTSEIPCSLSKCRITAGARPAVDTD